MTLRRADGAAAGGAVNDIGFRRRRPTRTGMSATGTIPTRSAALPITGAPNDYDALVDRIGDARCVLIGEASHGTHEFYVERARMTRALIEGAGFNAIAVEADWPSAYRLN